MSLPVQARPPLAHRLVPFDWSRAELLLMRFGFAALAVWMLDSYWSQPRLEMWIHQPHPNGLAHFADLTWLAKNAAAVLTIARPFIAAGLVAYVIGWLPALGLLPLGIFSVMAGSLMNSQGAINHATQLVTLCGLAQVGAYAWPEKSARASGLRAWLRPDQSAHRRAVWAVCTVIAAGYVVCGAIKLLRSDFAWISDAPNLSVQLMKTHYAQYFDSLVPPDPLFVEKIPQFIVDHPWLARFFFGIGLVLELGAFLALLGRRWACALGTALLALHLVIGWLFRLEFPTHEFALLIFWINLPGLPRLWRKGRSDITPEQDRANQLEAPLLAKRDSTNHRIRTGGLLTVNGLV